MVPRQSLGQFGQSRRHAIPVKGKRNLIEEVLIEVHRADRTIVNDAVNQPVHRRRVQQREHRLEVNAGVRATRLLTVSSVTAPC